MAARLAWVQTMANCIGSALDGGIRQVYIENTVDPLKKDVVMEMEDRFHKDSWNPFQVIAHAFAGANDCIISRAKLLGPHRIKLEILTKRRLGPVSDNDPFTMKDWLPGNIRRKREFLKFLCDKSNLELEEEEP